MLTVAYLQASLLGLYIPAFVPGPEPVKAVILLFATHGKLEEEEMKENGAVPVDPTVFYVKQTVCLADVV